MMEEEEEPNQYMKFYYNLVMAQRGQLEDHLFTYPNNYLGTFEKIGPTTPTLTTKTLNELYWQLGDMTFAERAAILANVCSPNNRNIRMMKRLAEINLVSGDLNAAKKYLRILQKTFVWKNWASQLLNALENNKTPQASAILQPYQEALMIYLAGTQAPEEEWKKYIKRTDVWQRFQQYNQQRGDPSFKDTYWYYFDKGTAPKLSKQE